jgi:RNA recognition motif-containing protein
MGPLERTRQTSKLNQRSTSVQERFRYDDDLSVYVGGVPHLASEQDLTSHFSRFGIVEAVSVAKNKDSQEPRGFAFVTFQSKEVALCPFFYFLILFRIEISVWNRENNIQ